MLYKMVLFFERLCARIKILDDLYKFFCKNLVEKEIKVTQITSWDRVLHIGCGSLPYTSAIIVKKTGAPVTAIDNDIKAVKDAKKYIHKQNLVLGVDVKQADGLTYSVSEFTVIVVSHGVMPKQKILKNIIQNMKPGARLIYRNPKGFLGRLYNKEKFILSYESCKVEQIELNRTVFRKSILVKKQED